MVVVLATVRLGLPGADAFLNPTLSAARLGGRSTCSVTASPSDSTRFQSLAVAVGSCAGRPLMCAADRSHRLVVGRARSGMRGLLRMSQEASTDVSTEDADLLSRLREEGSRLETEAGRDALCLIGAFLNVVRCHVMHA